MYPPLRRPNRDSPTKRARILDEAATLFATNGYKGTTLAMVAKASGAAVGSITHFFGDKPRLAAAVHGKLADDLVAIAERRLHAYRTDWSRAIHSLLRALLEWAEADPRRPRLISVLAAGATRPGQHAEDWLEVRLARVLAAWVQRLGKEIDAAARTPARLYAVILAPTMFSIAASASPSAETHKSSAAWIQVLADAACAAIGPRERKLVRPKRRR